MAALARSSRARPTAFLTTLAIFNWTNPYPVAPLRQARWDLLWHDFRRAAATVTASTSSLATNGALTTLASFDYIDGAFPSNDVVLTLDDGIYGTTALGGANGWGTVFRLAPMARWRSSIPLTMTTAPFRLAD